MTKPIIQGPYRTFRRLSLEESFIEFEGSTITIPMKGRRANSTEWMEDEVKLKAFMRLEIFPPYINNLGTREFQFIIRDWDLYGSCPMLNRLFFDDPRGFPPSNKYPNVRDYVPAFVTFNVSNNYHVGVDNEFNMSPFDIFSSERDIEIRNLTSHHTRVWTRIPERGGDGWFYSHPTNRIYWQILPADTVAKANLGNLLSVAKKDKPAPAIIFHKKPPELPGTRASFDINSREDVARYLIAASGFEPATAESTRGRAGNWIAATLRDRGHRANLTQIKGNTVLSSLRRARQPLEIRLALNAQMRDVADVNEFAKRTLANTKKASAISGWIQFVSPARSLGTADQKPDVGDPIDSADFPARITYAVNYDIHINREKFVEDQAGIAIAVGALEIPPRDVTVAFDKPHVGHVLQRYLEFGPGHCTGMHEITSDDYHDGLNHARYWRTVPLDPTDPRWGAHEDYDPTREY